MVGRSFSLHIGIIGGLAIFLSSGAVLAKEWSYQSYVSLEELKGEVMGEGAGDQLGAVMIAGDFNADGRDDLIVSSPFASFADRTWSGKVEVFFGGDLEADLVFWGENEGDQLGSSLALGDLNNDGNEDLIIGAHNARTGTGRNGKVYVLDGGKFWQEMSSGQSSSHTFDFALDKPFVELTGVADADGFGVALEVTDINGDGRDDLMVGAPFATAFSFRDAGIVYSFLGRDKGLDKESDFFFYSPENNQGFGSAISSGDYNHDGRIDLAVGAYLSDYRVFEQAGKVYIYEGRDVFKVTNGVADRELVSDINGSWFGFSLASGDFDGDGFTDLAAGSFPYAGNREEATIKIFTGMNETSVIEKPIGEAMFSSQLLAADLNNDSLDDLLIGAPGVAIGSSEAAGDVYVLAGGDLKSKYSVADFDLSYYFHGENPDDWFGTSLAVLDFNGDGFKDLAVGARYADAAGSTNNGKLVVLYGDGKPFGSAKTNLEKGEFVSRGELVNLVVDRLALRQKKSSLIDSCYEYLEFCFFNFTAMSSYGGLELERPLSLYPDVPSDHVYAEDIELATILGFVNGYMGEENSPFKPEKEVTRIEALKIVLAAADLVPPKYRFQLEDLLGGGEAILKQIVPFADVDARIAHMWWYPRYLNFAVDQGLVKESGLFRPDEKITTEELEDLLLRVEEYLAAAEALQKLEDSQ